jgi:hypothetical protein
MFLVALLEIFIFYKKLMVISFKIFMKLLSNCYLSDVVKNAFHNKWK